MANPTKNLSTSPGTYTNSGLKNVKQRGIQLTVWRSKWTSLNKSVMPGWSFDRESPALKHFLSRDSCVVLSIWHYSNSRSLSTWGRRPLGCVFCMSWADHLWTINIWNHGRGLLWLMDWAEQVVSLLLHIHEISEAQWGSNLGQIWSKHKHNPTPKWHLFI